MSELADLVEECRRLYDSFSTLLVEYATLSFDGNSNRHQQFRTRLAAHHDALKKHQARLARYEAAARFRRAFVATRQGRKSWIIIGGLR